MKNLFLFFLALISVDLVAQYPDNPHKYSTFKQRQKSVEQRTSLKNSSYFEGIKSQNIGPTIMSGRVIDIAVDPVNSAHFYVAYASGGVWETHDNGISFEPIFDANIYTINTGALCVDWNRNVIYVGTGEANSSRSSYAGYGLFSSRNNGKSWEWLGLGESHHISRVLCSPTDTNTIYVAVIGHLYSANKERGVFKTSDGGKTWSQSLFINENTGVIDLEINPKNPKQLMASAWDKGRRAWNFWESGPNTGIYITEDGGENWTKSTSFSAGNSMGRIGLAIADDGHIYALLDNQEITEKEDERTDAITKNQLKKISTDSFLNLNDSLLNVFLKQNRFPEKEDAKSIKKKIKKGELQPIDLYNYLTDSNAALFDNPVKGAELFLSTDFGGTWKKTHTDKLEKVCYTYGYYFGTVSVNPKNSNEVYIAGVPLLYSNNGGKNFEFIGGDNVHVDHHVLWVNPTNANHLINGNDGGINISFNKGKNWLKCNSIPVGQFYTVNIDHEKNYHVYGGLQDNGVWQGPNNYEYSTSWLEEGKYPYQRLLGGDGMQIQIDEENGFIYTGYQFGHYYRLSKKEGKNLYIHPMQELKEESLRWNWQTPILLSHHNPDILYMGSNRFHRSMDNGEHFETLSKDLSKGAKKGDISYGTISSIDESPIKFGWLVLGTDDGLVHVSKDGGDSWNNISKGLPEDLWVSRVVSSSHEKHRIYVALNGYRWDHFVSYIYCSEDFGATWKAMTSSLPNEAVNVIREDPADENILYVGTDAGLYVTLNRGSDFTTLGDLPAVAIHDLAIQPQAKDLIIGTHGRSIYKIQLENVYQLKSLSDSALWIAKPNKLKFYYQWGDRSYDWSYIQPKLEINYFTQNTNEITLELTTESGEVLMRKNIIPKQGFNSFDLLIAIDENKFGSLYPGKDGLYYPSIGNYFIVIRNADDELKTMLKVEK